MSSQDKRIIGRYRLLSEIGRGGMAVVYKAEHLDLNKTVAIKVMADHLSHDQQFFQRFYQEARKAANLDHPHIVTIYDVGQAEAGPYLVMKYLPGRTLAQIIKAEGALAPARVAQLITEVAEAVDYLHGEGLLHRDIKPGNIMVSPKDSATLMDFGLVKAMENTELTTPGLLVGTPAYMSPEQVKGGSASRASDIYSLGIVAYEMLTGRAPFQGESTNSLMYQVVHEPPPPLHLVNPRLSKQVTQVVERALHKEPARRYATAREFATALTSAVRGEAVAPDRNGSQRRQGSSGRPSPSALPREKGKGDATILLPGAAAGDDSGKTVLMPNAAQVAPVQPPSPGRWPPQPKQWLAVSVAGLVLALGLGWAVLNLRAISATQPTSSGAPTAAATQGARSLPTAAPTGPSATPTPDAVTRSQTLDKQAVALADQNAELSLLLAAEALNLARTNEAEDTLRLLLREFHQRLVVRDPTSDVRQVSFSSDGRLVLLAGGDNVARIVNVRTGQAVVTLRGHTAAITSATFGLRDQQVVTASADGTAQVWNAQTGQPLQKFQGHQGAINALSLSPDGRWLVTVGDDQTVRLWDMHDGQSRVLSGHTDRVTYVEFSRDGSAFVTASKDRTARVWSVKGDFIAELKGHAGDVVQAVFSPDGQSIATASADRSARVWATTTGTPRYSVALHTAALNSVAFSPDGRLLLTSSDDTTARVWDTQTGREVRTLAGHSAPVMTATWSQDGRFIVTASRDQTARIWDAATGGARLTLRGHQGAVWSAVFSPDGRQVMTGGADKTARLWDSGIEAEALVLRGHEKSVNQAVLSPTGNLVATASDDGTVRLWSTETGEATLTLTHPGPVYDVAFNPDGRLLASASADGKVRVWNVGDSEPVQVLAKHTNRVRTVVFSPDGKYLASAGEDALACVWEVGSWQGRELREHSLNIRSIEFSADSRLLVTASEDYSARTWVAATGQLDKTFVNTDGSPVVRARFSPDSRSVVLITLNGRAWQWDLATGKAAADPWRHEKAALDMAFSSDGRYLATSGEDTRVWLRYLPMNREPQAFQSLSSNINRLTFSPTGRWLAGGGQDGSVYVWDMATGQTSDVLRGLRGAVTSLAFSSTTPQILVASQDSTARLLSCLACVPIETLLALTRARVGRSLSESEGATYLQGSPRAEGTPKP